VIKTLYFIIFDWCQSQPTEHSYC